MATPSSVLTDFSFTPAEQEKLRQAAQTEVRVVSDHQEFLSLLKEAEVVCSYRITENWREQAPHLRWLQTPGAGVDRLLPLGILDPDNHIIVTTASGIHIVSISEYVFGSMLMFNRNWPRMVHLQAQHHWPRNGQEAQLGERELAGHTLAIVGMGSIGRRIAQVGRAFGMKVVASKASARPGDTDPDIDQLFPSAQLHDMLHNSDYIVIAVPLTPKTEHLIGEAELRAMKPHAYLVNIARGRVIDEAALIRALQEGWIAGAGLDVTAQEPLPAESPLYDLSNVILTPHISGASERYSERLADLFADNLQRYRTGQPLRNLYNPEKGY